MSEGSKFCCPLTGCCIGKILFTTLAAFALMMGFDFLYHGIYMLPDYTATASVWRTQAESEALMHISFISVALRAFAFAGAFCILRKACADLSICKGAKFGLLLGLFVGGSAFSSYMWLPIPMEIALKWLAGDMLNGAIVGGVLAAICKGKSCTSKGDAS